MIRDIFPTRIIIDELSQDSVLDLTTRFVENTDKNWEGVLTDHSIITSLISSYLGGEYEIVDGWIRSGYGSFDIHCDSHYGNQYVCVVQLYGEEDSGGDLVLYDPSWRNPQWMSDDTNPNSNTVTLPFKNGQVIIFPSDVWHKVTEYKGAISRITLNLMIRKLK